MALIKQGRIMDESRLVRYSKQGSVPESEQLYFKNEREGWGDGSAVKVLAMQARGPAFRSPEPNWVGMRICLQSQPQKQRSGILASWLVRRLTASISSSFD